MKIALVYDRVNTSHGGAERVLLELHELYPDAPLFTAVYNPSVAKWASVFEVKTGLLGKIPLVQDLHRELVFLMPQTFASFDFSDYDIVISITSAEAKNLTLPDKTLHVSYLLTPPRYLWSHAQLYQSGFLSVAKQMIFNKMRQLDYKAAQQPDVIIPISKLVRQRALKYYHRPIEPVIYPPWELKITPSNAENFKGLKDYFLVVSRFVPYKLIDRVIAATKALNQQLIIIGSGPEEYNLKNLAQNTSVKFFSDLTDLELADAYAHAKALVHPSEEDFGIGVLESMSIGTPVIVNRHAGAAELVTENKSGLLMDHGSVEEIKQRMIEIDKHDWSRKQIQDSISKYNSNQFQHQMREAIEKAWKQHKKG